MKRRTYLTTMLAGATVLTAQAADAAHPILLHLDMIVDPAKEKAMLQHFENVFRPAAIKHGNGYIDVKLLKLRSELMGKAPKGVNYRFALTYQSEELRQKWIASAVHQKVWPPMETFLADKNYTVLLFDAY